MTTGSPAPLSEDEIAEIEARAGAPRGRDVVRAATHVGEALMQPLCAANWTLDAITDLASTLTVQTLAFDSSRDDIPRLLATISSLRKEKDETQVTATRLVRLIHAAAITEELSTHVAVNFVEADCANILIFADLLQDKLARASLNQQQGDEG